MKKIILSALLIFVATSLYAQNHIIVSKKNFTITVIGPKADTLCCYKFAVGLNLGNKQKVGDKVTIEKDIVE